MYKAVFTDMDGTLLRKDHTVSSKTRQTIEKLIERGIMVIPISARPLHGMTPITDNVFPASTTIVSLNGSYIYHNGKIIYQVSMPLHEAAAIHALVEDQPLSAMYYSQMEWYADKDTDAVKKEQKITPVPVTIQSFGKTLSGWEMHQKGPNKILIAGDEKTILSIEQKMLEQFNGSLNIYKSQPKYLEAMHPSASKSNAIQNLMNIYGLRQDEIIAIGDNYNDKGMIEFAGMGIAMGNAPEEIKAVANYVTDSNNHDGVAKALDHFFS
jgi:hypothetical protein